MVAGVRSLHLKYAKECGRYHLALAGVILSDELDSGQEHIVELKAIIVQRQRFCELFHHFYGPSLCEIKIYLVKEATNSSAVRGMLVLPSELHAGKRIK